MFHPKPAQQAAFLLDLAERLGLDTLSLTEARTPARQLRKQAKGSPYKIKGRPRSSNPMVRDNLMLVRRGLPTSRVHIRKWGPRWERRRGRKGKHPARRALYLRVAGLNRLVFHGPPRPHNSNWPGRRRASIAFYEKARDLLGTWTRKGKYPWLTDGDFNLKAGQVAKRLPGKVHIPKDPDGIVAGPGVQVTDVRVHNLQDPHYDHPLITATIHY